MGIKKDGIQIHLSEHYRDTTPGSKVFIICDEIKKVFPGTAKQALQILSPRLEKNFYNSLCIGVINPFGNRVFFNKYLQD